jgi:hypothetical protein
MTLFFRKFGVEMMQYIYGSRWVIWQVHDSISISGVLSLCQESKRDIQDLEEWFGGKVLLAEADLKDQKCFVRQIRRAIGSTRHESRQFLIHRPCLAGSFLVLAKAQCVKKVLKPETQRLTEHRLVTSLKEARFSFITDLLFVGGFHFINSGYVFTWKLLPRTQLKFSSQKTWQREVYSRFWKLYPSSYRWVVWTNVETVGSAQDYRAIFLSWERWEVIWVLSPVIR